MPNLLTIARVVHSRPRTPATLLLPLLLVLLLLLTACTGKVVITVTVTAPSTTVGIGTSLQLSATVNGSANQVVAWSVNGQAGGSAATGLITAGGLYLAPAVRPNPFVITISARSGADPTAEDDVQLTITAPGQLYVAGAAGGAPLVAVFHDARQATGDVAADRLLTGAATTLDGPFPLAVVGDDLWVGGCGGQASIRIWNDFFSLDGDIAPDRVIAGPATGMGTCAMSLVVDEQRDLVYVLEYIDSVIRVFGGLATLTGDASPLREFTSLNLTTTYSDGWLFLDAANDRLYHSSLENDRIEVFDAASTLQGDVQPARSIQGPNGPMGITVDLARDILYAALPDQGEIQVFDGASSLDGPVTADRVIPVAPSYLNLPAMLFLDQENDELYASAQIGAKVQVWENASESEGVLPNREISSTASGIDWVTGLFLDLNR